MAAISMIAYITEHVEGRFHGIFGFSAKGYGSDEVFDSLEAALRWVNRDGGGVMLFVEEDEAEAG
jgi:hypothetical protein